MAKIPKSRLFCNQQQESALGHSSNFLMFGQNLKGPFDTHMEFTDVPPIPAPVSEHITTLLTGLEQARHVVSESLINPLNPGPLSRK